MDRVHATHCIQSKKLDALLMVAGFVAVFVAGDRVLDRIRLPHVLNSSNGVRWKWELYEQTNPPPNVVFMGCSFGMFAISPTIVDEEVRVLCGETPHSLNICASAASMLTESLLARRVVESGRLPDVVYLEVSPVSTVAVPHSWLESGLRALGEARDIPVAASVNTVLLRETLGSTVFASYRQWKDCRLMARLMLHGASLHPTSKFRRDGVGWAEWTGGIRASAGDSAGPSPGQAGGDALATFVGRNPSAEALRDTVRMLRAAGVTVRLVEMPHASTALPALDPRKNGVYRAFMDRAVADLGVALVRPERDLVTDADFFDYGHLNARGAEKLSRWLARDVAATLVARGAGRSATRVASSPLRTGRGS